MELKRGMIEFQSEGVGMERTQGERARAERTMFDVSVEIVMWLQSNFIRLAMISWQLPSLSSTGRGMGRKPEFISCAGLFRATVVQNYVRIDDGRHN